ncbi:MAG: TlpA family protein disulfide reductase, partial [Actinomycetales bacterium]|nr:TlpA family protein disulfide reductase [Actinomycetales bacterium]
AAYEESDDTVVLAVYLSEDADDVRPYVERLGMTFTHLPDPDERLASRFHVIGVPMHYFIDREGVVRALKFGVLSRPQMDAELAAIAG